MYILLKYSGKLWFAFRIVIACMLFSFIAYSHESGKNEQSSASHKTHAHQRHLECTSKTDLIRQDILFSGIQLSYMMKHVTDPATVPKTNKDGSLKTADIYDWLERYRQVNKLNQLKLINL